MTKAVAAKPPSRARRGGRSVAQSAPPTTPTSHSAPKPVTRKPKPKPTDTAATAKNTDAVEVIGAPEAGPSRRRSSRNAQRGQRLTAANLAKLNNIQEGDEEVDASATKNQGVVEGPPNPEDLEVADPSTVQLPPGDSLPEGPFGENASYPTYHTLRVIKRSLTKLTNALPQLENEYHILQNLLGVAKETSDEATVGTRSVLWLRTFAEADVYKKMHRDRRLWDGTFAEREDRFREARRLGRVKLDKDGDEREIVDKTEWEEFLQEVQAEYNDMKEKELAELNKQIEEMDRKNAERDERMRARRRAKGKQSDDENTDSDDTSDSDESGSGGESSSGVSSTGSKRTRTGDRDEDRGNSQAKKRRK